MGEVKVKVAAVYVYTNAVESLYSSDTLTIIIETASNWS